MTAGLGFRAVCATALANAVVCRRRSLTGNQISTIAIGTFTGLTALIGLYGACGFCVRCLYVDHEWGAGE
jgi:hypothetical protein